MRMQCTIALLTALIIQAANLPAPAVNVDDEAYHAARDRLKAERQQRKASFYRSQGRLDKAFKAERRASRYQQKAARHAAKSGYPGQF